MRQLFRTAWNEVGFSGFNDLAATLIGYKSTYGLVLQVSIASFATVVAFVQTHVFDPPVAIYTLIVLLIADTILGAIVALQKGEKFNPSKFTRLIPIMLANLFVMHLSHKFKLSDPTMFFWLPNAVFGFIGTRVFLSVVRNLVILKFLKGEFLVFIANKIEPSNIAEVIKKNLNNLNQSDEKPANPTV